MKSFKTFIQEATLTQNTTDMISSRIFNILEMANQVHLFHWLTTEHKVHVALNDLFGELRDHADSLAEAWIGLGNTVTVPAPQATLASGDKTIIQKYLEDQLEIINHCVEITNTTELMSMNAVAVDIQADLQKAIYLIRD
jgi:DNA-binding ferritin-like protein